MCFNRYAHKYVDQFLIIVANSNTTRKLSGILHIVELVIIEDIMCQILKTKFTHSFGKPISASIITIPDYPAGS